MEPNWACVYDESGQRVDNREVVRSEVVEKNGEKGATIEKNKGVNMVHNSKGIPSIATKEIPKIVELVPTL